MLDTNATAPAKAGHQDAIVHVAYREIDGSVVGLRVYRSRIDDRYLCVLAHVAPWPSFNQSILSLLEISAKGFLDHEDQVIVRPAIPANVTFDEADITIGREFLRRIRDRAASHCNID